MDARELIEKAFDRLASRPGYAERPDQRQLALLISDLIEEGGTGLIEAPTGLGKSLASLIPALAHAIVHGRRTVIATYTNVLAEQYWKKDLPLAMELLEATAPAVLLMGRQRYACLAELEQEAPHLIDDLLACSPLGIESEIRETLPSAGKLWRKIVSPPACPGRFCPYYEPCYYYSARRKALKAMVVITNHAVVLQDALMSRVGLEDEEEDPDKKGLFGNVDFTIFDEAHDLFQSGTSALEFVLDGPLIERIIQLSSKIEIALDPTAHSIGRGPSLRKLFSQFKQDLSRQGGNLQSLASQGRAGAVLDVAPGELKEHPAITKSLLGEQDRPWKELSITVSEVCGEFVQRVGSELKGWQADGLLLPSQVKPLRESIQNYLLAIREAGIGAAQVSKASGGSVSYVGSALTGPFMRHDVVDLREPLDELLWAKRKWACLSATLVLDGSFEHFSRVTGAKSEIQEILPSPFDYASHAAVYMPPVGRLMDPTAARKQGLEAEYYAGLAREIGEIMVAMQGRCLVLFHSRKEMEGTFALMQTPPELPIYMQPRFGAGSIGQKFRSETASSLFALRSFWTGFDAPGETLSCVALVRVPFEVPTDPAQLVRMAGLQKEGMDPFKEHTLPQAKLMIRQGVGRLIRRAEDKGIIALLDARLRTRSYGEEILENLPAGMRTFDDVGDAVGWLGL